MSFVVSDFISDNQQRSNTVGQRLADADFRLFLNDAVDYFYTNLKIPTAQRQTSLIAYPGVLEYPLPSDFQALITPKRPYSMHSPSFNHTTERDFVHWPYGRTTSIRFNGAQQILILQETAGRVSGVDSCDDISGWSTFGDASGLYLDDQVFSSGQGSLAFVVTPSGGTYGLSRTLVQALDLTDFKSKAKLFLDLFLPETNTVATPTLTVRIGNDASNYWESSASVAFNGQSLATGLVQVGFDLATATPVGSPSLTDVDYFFFQGQDDGTSATAGTYRLDNIFIAQGTYYQIPYYSQYVIQDVSGAWKRKVTSNDDTVVCPPDCDLAIQFKCMEQACAVRLKDSPLANYWKGQLKPKEQQIKAKYPSMEVKNQTDYYKPATRMRF